MVEHSKMSSSTLSQAIFWKLFQDQWTAVSIDNSKQNLKNKFPIGYDTDQNIFISGLLCTVNLAMLFFQQDEEYKWIE